MNGLRLPALLLAAGATAAPAGDDAGAGRNPIVTISIVGTNDLHGHIEPLPRLGGYLANLRRRARGMAAASCCSTAGTCSRGRWSRT